MTKFFNYLISFFKTHKYGLVLLYIPAYLLCFALLQAISPAEVHIISCPLDAMIPTIPAFFIFYALWWLIFPGALVYYLFFSEKMDFLKLCFILFIGYSICLITYTVYPNGLEIRQPITGSDIFSRCILWLRSIDPPRNVCPSMHVSSTVAIDITVRTDKKMPLWVKNLMTLVTILICLSTLFIKQHSVIDVILGFLMSVVLYLIWRLVFIKKT